MFGKDKKESEKSDEQKVEKTPEEKASDYFYDLHITSRIMIEAIRNIGERIDEQKVDSIYHINRIITKYIEEIEAKVPLIDPKKYKFLENQVYNQLEYENPDKDKVTEIDDEQYEEQYELLTGMIQAYTTRIKIILGFVKRLINEGQWYAVVEAYELIANITAESRENTEYENEEANEESQKRAQNIFAFEMGWEMPHKDIE